jgi:transposase
VKLLKKLQNELLPDEDIEVLFYDEAFFRRESTVIRGWYPKGRKAAISCPATYDKVGVCGAVSQQSGSLYSLIFDGFDSRTFIFFLSWLINETPIEKKMVIILDNATSHKSAKVKEFAAEHSDRLQLVFLPPYSPDLNPIERVWKDLRYQVTHNVYFKNWRGLQSAIIGYLKRWAEPNQKMQSLCCIN